MPTLSSIASSTTLTASTSPATACYDHAPTGHPRIDQPASECQKLSASEAPRHGRHHVGTPGDIISDCLGDFVGICIFGAVPHWLAYREPRPLRPVEAL